jgi:hypothetical protein
LHIICQLLTKRAVAHSLLLTPILNHTIKDKLWLHESASLCEVACACCNCCQHQLLGMKPHSAQPKHYRTLNCMHTNSWTTATRHQARRANAQADGLEPFYALYCCCCCQVALLLLRPPQQGQQSTPPQQCMPSCCFLCPAVLMDTSPSSNSRPLLLAA